MQQVACRLLVRPLHIPQVSEHRSTGESKSSQHGEGLGSHTTEGDDATGSIGNSLGKSRKEIESKIGERNA